MPSHSDLEDLVEHPLLDDWNQQVVMEEEEVVGVSTGTHLLVPRLIKGCVSQQHEKSDIKCIHLIV